MVTPLSMSVIGIKLASLPLKNLFTDKTAYLSVALKNVVMSLTSVLAVAFLPVDAAVKNVLFFTLSMPSATMAVLLSVRFESDSASATINVLLSTVLSVLTIPVIFILFDFLCTV